MIYVLYESLFVRAASCGDTERANKRVAGAGKEEKDMALAAAARENHAKVRCLLAAGTDPDAKYGGVSILTWASIDGYTDLVRELMDAGADITKKDEDGMTAMQLAAKNKHRDVVALLLAKANELKKTK
jgi:ankyrin repeat protein